MRVLVSFSGGKDSTLALYRAMQQGHEVCALMTTSSGATHSWFHDIDLDIIQRISDMLSCGFEPIMCAKGDDYTKDYENALVYLKDKYQLDAVVFGDIDLMAHLDWCTQRCHNCNLEAIFPLWQQDRVGIVEEFVDLGFKTMIKRVTKGQLDKSYLGKILDHALIKEFSELGIDVCGENGEYHTLVFDGPIFKQAVPLKLNDIIEYENSYSLQVSLDE